MWTDDVVAVAAAAQALLLIVAAGIAWRQVRESVNLRRDQARPYVVVYARSLPTSRHLLELVVENFGLTPARDTVIVIEPPIESTLNMGAYPVRNWRALSHPISQLVPRQRLSTLLDSALGRFADTCKLPHQYRVTLTYRDDAGRPYQDESVLDLEASRGSSYVDQKGIGDVVKELQSLNKVLDSWTA